MAQVDVWWPFDSCTKVVQTDEEASETGGSVQKEVSTSCQCGGEEVEKRKKQDPGVYRTDKGECMCEGFPHVTLSPQAAPPDMHKGRSIRSRHWYHRGKHDTSSE